MRRILVTVALLAGCPLTFAEAPAFDAFPLRNHNAFLQVFGLPAFQTHELVAPEHTDFALSYDVANDADDADRLGERLIIDAESQVLSFSVRRRFGERFELGIEVPWVRHSGGNLDSLIFNFHDAVGLSNSSRDGPDDEYRLLFEREGELLFDTSEPTSGIGDVQLSGAMALGKATLRAGIKLPTGDPDKLTGSGAADFSLGIYGGSRTAIFDRDLAYSGFLGVLVLGDGDVMPTLQRSAVPFGGAALRWQATNKVALATQLYVQGPYFDAALDELGGNTFQLSFGIDWRLRRSLLRFAIVEDIAAAAAPDFALHLSFRSFGG